MSLQILCRDDRERAVVRLWRRNHLSPGSMIAYLQWIRRFRTYCQRRDLDEVSQLTLKGVKRFTRAYVGPRTRGPVGPSSCFAARNALHAWACALQVSVPPWRAARPPAKLTTLLSAYIQYRRAHCGVARDIETAKTFLALLPSGGKSISKATPADIDRFVSHLSARYSKQTVADSCSSLRAFLRFLRITNRSRHDLAASVISPRVRFAERPPRALPWTHVRRILGSIQQKEPPGKRDFAMLLMMATYGLGAAEVLGLQIEAVDWKSEVLRVRRPKTGAWIAAGTVPDRSSYWKRRNGRGFPRSRHSTAPEGRY